MATTLLQNEQEVSILKKFLDSEGVAHLWQKVKDFVKTNAAGSSVSWNDITDKPDVALKSDISGVYHFKGSVNNYSSLPTDNEIGDVWDVMATDMNYGWTGEKWDPLGQVFEIETISNEEIDSIFQKGE